MVHDFDFSACEMVPPALEVAREGAADFRPVLGGSGELGSSVLGACCCRFFCFGCLFRRCFLCFGCLFCRCFFCCRGRFNRCLSCRCLFCSRCFCCRCLFCCRW